MNFSEVDPARHVGITEDYSRTDQNATVRRQSISIIFPAFNEEENIRKAVEHGRKAMSKFFADIEIIVVNDGSSDATAAIVDEMAAENSDVVLVHHEVNRGYGAALRSGIYKASKELIFFTDSDLQFDLEEIQHLQEWVHKYDIVAGYRARRADPAHRRFNAWGWNVLVRLVLGLKIKDIDCAFKLFRREVFQNIRLETVGAMINTEILTLAQRNNMKIKEVPVSHYPRLAGEQTGANFKVILKALRELFVMREKLKLRAGEIRRNAVSYKSRYNEM
ncbi:MAG: glycosyltransferase family 2 protein [Chromatiales bacterium]|jgi:glycosyltransferase involved in cell wall biosynthesis